MSQKPIVFGMYEMEKAAARIIKINQDEKRTSFSVSDFEGKYEQNGFVELVHRGWLEHGKYNGSFVASADFLGRVSGE